MFVIQYVVLYKYIQYNNNSRIVAVGEKPAQSPSDKAYIIRSKLVIDYFIASFLCVVAEQVDDGVNSDIAVTFTY